MAFSIKIVSKIDFMLVTGTNKEIVDAFLCPLVYLFNHRKNVNSFFPGWSGGLRSVTSVKGMG